MLNYIGYIGPSIIGKHIIDNSCGDGAFLRVVVTRYCKESIKLGYNQEAIRKDLSTYIHGIDTDIIAYERCLDNLSQIANEFAINNVVWDLHNQSALSLKAFNGKMDFVIGNPPYVRVHNLDSSYEEVKQYKFAHGGMTDLYLAFFELGFNMLNSTGKLCYITPSSWLNSIAATNMRSYILKEQNLVSLTDLEHFQAFEHVTAYTIISLFAKNKHEKNFDYFVFDGNTHKRKLIDNISIEDSYIDSAFYLSDKKQLKQLREIKTKQCPKFVSVKNGFATLADNVFIGENIPQSNITIKVLKASTGKWYKCLFPYDRNGKLLPPEIVFSEQQVAFYFEAHKNEILKGKKEYPTYYEFGRTQALLDVWRNKIAINTLLRTEKDLKIEEVKSGEGIFSGLYIISSIDIPFEDIKSIISTSDFAKYISLLKKYKSGGYYTFSSKDVQQYINYFITHKSDKHYVDKSSFFGQDSMLF